MSEFTVASLNLCNFTKPPFASYEWHNILTSEQWTQKRSWLTESIIAADADMIAFQEVFSITELKELCFELGYHYFICPDRPNIENDFVFSQPCVAIASRYKAKWVKIPPKMQSRFARYPAIARVSLPNGAAVTAISVHLKSQRASAAPDNYTEKQSQLYGQWVSSFQRADEANALFDIAKKQINKAPVIIMGDFNQSRDSQSLQGLWKNNLLQPLDTLLGVGPFNTFYHRFTPNAIDHILVSDLVTAVDMACFDDHLPTNGTLSSDHAMLVGKIDVESEIGAVVRQ
jgi:endonuclease/exonuclease/phosphatase family metal-dependent hydrolase